MSARNYGDSLAGKSWDAVRAVRRQVIGNTGELLDASVVPEEFHDLLPFASLLSSGEEPLSEDFWSALDSDARNVFVSRLDRARAARVQEWASGLSHRTERWSFFYVCETYRVFLRMASTPRRHDE